MSKHTRLHDRKHAKRDPLQGAPGHLTNDLPETAQPVAVANGNSASAAIPSENFSPADEDKPEGWKKPLNKIKAHPVASAAAIAAGVGAVVLTRKVLATTRAGTGKKPAQKAAAAPKKIAQMAKPIVAKKLASKLKAGAQKVTVKKAGKTSGKAKAKTAIKTPKKR